MVGSLANSNLRVLALVPPDKSGKSLSRYSFLDEELQEMAKHGVNVHVVSNYTLVRHCIAGVAIHPMPRFQNLIHTTKSVLNFFPSTRQISRCCLLETILDVLKREKIDVIYSPFLWPYCSAGLPAARSLKIPVVVSLRGADVLIEPSVGYGRTLESRRRKATAKTLSEATKIIGVSQAVVERAVELGAARDRTTVILKGVSQVRFTPGNKSEAREKLGLEEIPTVLFVGNLIRLKGVELLIQACNLVRPTQDHQLVICGVGPEQETLEELAVSFGLKNRVKFAGRISRELIPDYFRACDVLVLPSRSEGSGNVIVEAAATGRPVIGTDGTGITDYIDTGETGFLFKKNDVDDLAEKISRVLDNPVFGEELGRNGYQRVIKKHKYSHMVERIIETCREAAKSHSKNRNCPPADRILSSS